MAITPINHPKVRPITLEYHQVHIVIDLLKVYSIKEVGFRFYWQGPSDMWLYIDQIV